MYARCGILYAKIVVYFYWLSDCGHKKINMNANVIHVKDNISQFCWPCVMRKSSKIDRFFLLANFIVEIKTWYISSENGQYYLNAKLTSQQLQQSVDTELDIHNKITIQDISILVFHLLIFIHSFLHSFIYSRIIVVQRHNQPLLSPRV